MVLIIIAVCLALSSLIQGGFYGICYLLIGALCLLVLPFNVKKLPSLNAFLTFSALCLLYILSALLHGGGYDSLLFAARPLCFIVFMVLIYNLEDKQRLLGLILYTALFVALVSVGAYVTGVSGMVSVGRLQGTFQYANAVGIYFAATALASCSAQEDKLKAVAIPLETALFLTQSVGAIICLLLGNALCLFLTKEDRKEILREFCGRLTISLPCAVLVYLSQKISPLLSLLVAMVIFVAYRRHYGVAKKLMQSKIVIPLGTGIMLIAVFLAMKFRFGAFYTYIERLMQLWDSLIAILNNPLVGLGPGAWQHVYPIWQSYPYDSAYLHSSIGQVGIDVGVLGVACFVYLVYVYLKNCKNLFLWTAGVVIIVHSFLDITLNFTGVSFLLITLFYMNDKSPPCALRKLRPIFIIPFCFFVYLFVGQISLRSAETSKDFQQINKYFMGSYTNNRNLLNQYVENGQYENALELELPYPTAEMYYIKSNILFQQGKLTEAWELAQKCIDSAPLQELGYKWAFEIASAFPTEERDELCIALQERRRLADGKRNVLADFMKRGDSK